MSELRKEPIVGRWVIVSTERGKRPADFDLKTGRTNGAPGEDAFCPFCPGHEEKTPREVLSYRAHGTTPNATGWQLRVVPNMFPALKIEGDLDREGVGLYDKMNGIGAHEVIIESPDHGATLATLPVAAVEEVIWAYRDRMLDLKKDRRFRYALIFKNHGEAAGAPLPHPHSQLIALPVVPKTVGEELDGARSYYQYKERCIFCDIIKQELAQKVRIIEETQEFLAFAPFAGRSPFETWILPKRHTAAFEDGQKQQYGELAKILSNTLRRLDRALQEPAYNFILHTAPFAETRTGDSCQDYYHWHFELLPKLSRIAGFEWGSGFYINPTPPEEAAQYLREIRLDTA